MPYTVKLANGQFLTGKTWRKDPLFGSLPFITALLQDDDMVQALEVALAPAIENNDGRGNTALIRIADGLERHLPFSDTPAVEIILNNARSILGPGNDTISHSHQIWALLSSFVVFDRLCATFGVAAISPGRSVPRNHCEQSTIGTAVHLLNDLTPPTKILSKFCLTWATRPQTNQQATADAVEPCYDPGNIALHLSTRLVAKGKQKDLINMTSGIEMLALAITISTENGGIFPEKASEFKQCLLRLGASSLQNNQLSFLATEAPVLHKGIRNLLMTAFAISPILALSSHSWQGHNVNSLYLCRVFHSLGNNRPQSLMVMENHVLSAAMSLACGGNINSTLNNLHSAIKGSEDALTSDLEASNWFHLSTPTDLLKSAPSQSLPSAEINYASVLQIALERVSGQETHLGGLASPPYSPSNPPSASWGRIHHSPSVDPQLLQLDRVNLCEEVDLALVPLPENYIAGEQSPDAREDHPMTEVGEESRDAEMETEISEEDVEVEEPEDIEMETASDDRPQEFKERENEEDSGEDEDEEDEEPEMKVNDMQPSLEEAKNEEEDEEDAEEEEEEKEEEEQEQGKMEQDEGEQDEEQEEEEEEDTEEDKAKAEHLPTLDLRRSARRDAQPANRTTYQERRATPREQPARHASKSKVSRADRPGNPSKSKPVRANLFELEDDDERPKLLDVGESRRHPTISVDISGWGSTYTAGPTPHRHVPVQIVTRGEVDSTGIDAETLRLLERRVQEGFVDGVPPHLLPNARSLAYTAHSNQSRFFVSPHSEYKELSPQQILGVLRDRHIIVHGHPFEHTYGWNLATFARLYDVDRTTTVHVADRMDPFNPELRHFKGTLRDIYEITTTFPEETCPPLNAISLPAGFRNLLVPSQWECIASHELAQSRVPVSYATIFDVPDTRPHTEWSLIGGKDAISSLHIDCEGFGTVVVVLEGSKYWIIATRFGDEEDICSSDSLGPNWDPYLVNQGNNLSQYRFEAVHLRKGDMLIMRPGTLHWVLGTSNAVCVGRHFYASSTIMISIISLVQTFLLGGALTNASHLETRTLLFQMMHLWSMRVDKRDVDGAHIPDISSPIEMFDVIYLGVFIILSRAFDSRFYDVTPPPPALYGEITSAESHFRSLLHLFSDRFIMVLEGVPIDPSYIVKRMLSEFAAAVVVFAKAIRDSHAGDIDMDVDVHGGADEGQEADAIPYSKLKGEIDDIIGQSYPEVIKYYQHCVASGHKDFVWTGPPVTIVPRSEAWSSILPFLMPEGERLDHPTFSIFNPDTNPPSTTAAPATATSTPLVPATTTKRRGSRNVDDLHVKKRRL